MASKLAAKVAGARASAGGNYIKPGKYEFSILKLMCEEKFGGNFFIFELRVDKSEPVLSGVEPNKVGTFCSYVGNLDTNKAAPGNAKQFIMALLGEEDESAISADDFANTFDKLTAKDNPAFGLRIADETFEGTIRGGPNAGKPITKHRWAFIETTDEQDAANRATFSKAAA